MEELLGTWRTGGADGGELFRTPEEGARGRVQRGIEAALFGERGRGGGMGGGGRPQAENEAYNGGVRLSSPSLSSSLRPAERALTELREQVQQLPQPATPAERSSVLFDIRRLLHQREQAALLSPLDSVNQGQVSALKQVRLLSLSLPLHALTGSMNSSSL